MYSNMDLLMILILAICFVLLFRLQRKFFSAKYYATSRRIFGRGITLRMTLIRFLLIFGYGYLIYRLTGNEGMVIFSTLLGSFLIVWPVLLNPSSFDIHDAGDYSEFVIDLNFKGWFLLFASYMLFIISSTAIAFLSVNFGDYIFYKTLDSFESWLASSWWLLLIIVFGIRTSHVTENILEKVLGLKIERLKRYQDNEE